MHAVPAAWLNQVLSRAGIQVAAAASNIGRHLTYREDPRRTVVIHLAEAETPEYLQELMSRVLGVGDEWLLLSRYASVSELGLLPAGLDMAAIAFAQSEQPRLVEYLCTRPTTADSASADLYVLSGGGDVLVTWDHHTAVDGIDVQLRSVADATRLLVTLNELGAELEVYYT